MALPFRMYGDSDWASNPNGPTFDVVFSRPPTNAELESFAEIVAKRLKREGTLLSHALFSGTFAYFDVGDPGKHSDDVVVHGILRALHRIVPIEDAILLNATFAKARWTVASVAHGPPLTGPSLVDEGWPEKIRQRAVDFAWPRPTASSAFNAVLTRLATKQRQGVVARFKPRKNGIGIREVNRPVTLEPPVQPEVSEAQRTKREALLMAFSDEVYSPPNTHGVGRHRPAWKDLQASGFDPSGTRFVIATIDALWLADTATLTRRRLCGLQEKMRRYYNRWTWLNDDHLMVVASNGVRVYSLALGDEAVEVASLLGAFDERVKVFHGGRLLMLGGYSMDTDKRWTEFLCFNGELKRIGDVAVDLKYAGAIGKQLFFRYPDGLIELTNVQRAIGAPPKRRSVALVAGQKVPVPTVSYDLTASALGTTLTTTRDLADYRGLFVACGDESADLSAVVLAACAHQKTTTTDALDITADGETALVAAGQGRRPRAATLMCVDLDSELVTSTFEYLEDGFGPILSVHSVSDGHCLVVSESGCTLYSCTSPSWTVVHSRKHKEALDVVGSQATDPGLVAIITASNDGVLVVGVTSKHKIKLLGKMSTKLQKAIWQEGELLGLDYAGDWRHVLSADAFLDKLK